MLSYQRLGRAEDPNFTIKVAVVSASWPGATAAEMRDQVADPIEKKLQELPYFDKVETYTTAGFMAATVAFRDDTPPERVPDLFYQTRKKLDDLRPSLPQGVLGPLGQRRVRRRLFGRLHADRRRARPRPAQGRRRGHAPAAAARCPTSTRST